MPHVLLEYSANVLDAPDVPRLLVAIHEALAATGMFELADFKGRAVRHEAFAVADGAPDRAFAALTVRLLSGRDDEAKGVVSRTCLEVLRAAFPRTAAGRRLSLSVEVSDIHRASYRRETSAGPRGA